MIKPGLEKALKGWTLDTARAWRAAAAEWTGEIKGDDKVYKRGKPMDHKAFKIVLELDIVAPRRSGDIAMINYNNKEGCFMYKKLADKYAPEIRNTIKKYKNKNDRQAGFKQIMHS